MTDNDRDIGVEATPPQHNKQTSKGSCCHSHLPLYISVAALLMAGYSVFITTSKHDSSAMQSQIVELESKVAGINNQLNVLSDGVQSNRENLVQNKLKKALENIRDIGELAEDGAKATISEVEKMLQNLTDIGHRLTTPEEQELSQADEVISTSNGRSIDEPITTTLTNAQTNKTNGQNSEISNDPNNNNDTVAKDTKQPVDSTARTDQPEVNLAPAATPSEAQAF